MSETENTATITITHNYEEGTLLAGTSRGDAVSGVLGSRNHGGLGWKWSRNLGCWYLPQSRDKLSKDWQIKTTAERLHELGYKVTVEVNNDIRSMADQEADRATRMEERTDALSGKADRLSAEADRRRAAADAVFDNIPFGQPMLPGHHSYKADRNRRERAHNNFGKSIELSREAENTAERADTAQRHMDYRTEPTMVARRITKLEAELRGYQRSRAGRKDWVQDEAGQYVYRHVDPSPASASRTDLRIRDTENQLTYWRGIRDEQIAAGLATNFSRDTIAKGDAVLASGSWREVVRVNAKSVSVVTMVTDSGFQFTGTVRYDQIRDVRKGLFLPKS